MKRLKLTDVLLVGVLLGALVLAGYELLPLESAFTLSCILLVAGLLLGGLLIKMGFDYYRVKYSFLLVFLAVVIVLYEILVVMLLLIYGREAKYRDVISLNSAIATTLTPYLGVILFGGLADKVKSTRLPKKVAGKVLALPLKTSWSFKKLAYQLDATMWFFFLFGSIYLLIFMLVPIILVLVNAATPPAGGTWWDNFVTAITRNVKLKPYVVEPWTRIELPGGECIIVIRGVDYGPILNSIIAASVVTLMATILGVSIGYILARYRFPGHTLLRILAIVPLFNTPFINAFAIKLLWSEGGPVSALSKMLTGCSIRLESIVGVIITQIFTFYPIVYLNAYTAFINVDPSTEEQAENLGARGFRIFRTVTLPLALPGIAAGATLVFVFSLEDLMAPIVFNERSFMSRVIYDELMTTYYYGFVRPDVAALGVIMLLYALVAFIAIRNYVSMRSYAMISRGGRWNPRVRRLGLFGLLLVYLLILPLVVFTSAPQIMVVLMAFGALKPYIEAGTLVFSQPIIDYFYKVLLDPAISKFITNTLLYAGVSVVIAVILATSVAYCVSRLKARAVPSMLDSFATAPLAIPGLVFALGYYIFFTEVSKYLFEASRQLGTVQPLSWLASALEQVAVYISPVSLAFQAWLVFIIAYSVRRLPYVVRSVFAGFQQVHENLEEAALNLGAPRYKVVFGVVLPFIIGYILSGALLGFIYMATEVSTSITFGGIRPDQAPLTYYMGITLAGAAGEGPMLVAAMGALLILIQLAVVVVIVFVFKQRYAFIGL